MRLPGAEEGLQMPLMWQLSTASLRRERKGRREPAGLAEEERWRGAQKTCSEYPAAQIAQLVVGRIMAAAVPHTAHWCHHTSLEKVEKPCKYSRINLLVSTSDLGPIQPAGSSCELCCAGHLRRVHSIRSDISSESDTGRNS